jgi:hypothetical protein
LSFPKGIRCIQKAVILSAVEGPTFVLSQPNNKIVILSAVEGPAVALALVRQSAVAISRHGQPEMQSHQPTTWQAPSIQLEPTDHPLSIEQREGISQERSRELAEQFMHGWMHPDSGIH